MLTSRLGLGPILLCLFTYLLSISSAIGQEVRLFSAVVPNDGSFKNDQYLCLGQEEEWRKSNPAIFASLRDLKVVFPDLFQTIEGQGDNCFAPEAVPYPAQAAVDRILRAIDRFAGEELKAFVLHDGTFILRTGGTGLDEPAPPAKSQLRNESKTLGRKVLRAQLLIGTVEAWGMGMLISLPCEYTKWEEDWAEDARRSFVRAWTTAPVWDRDEPEINYIGHPLAGGYYYNALRSQGASRFQSFLFAVVQSTFWEYGIEALAERPSIQDLVTTPVGGAIIGELSHRATLRMKRKGFTLPEKVLVTLINPIYVVNNGFRAR